MELLIVRVKLYFLLAFIIQEILEVKFQVEVRDKFDAYFLLIFLFRLMFSNFLTCSQNFPLPFLPLEDVFKFFQHGDHHIWDYGNENLKISCTGTRIKYQWLIVNPRILSVTSFNPNAGIAAFYANVGGGNLATEVPAIHLSMKNSNLKCVEHENQDHMATDVCLEGEEIEEFDDFDPFFFIKNLPELSAVVPTYRPVLLPKQTRSCPSTTLVLDLDGKHALIISYLLLSFIYVAAHQLFQRIPE